MRDCKKKRNGARETRVLYMRMKRVDMSIAVSHKRQCEMKGRPRTSDSIADLYSHSTEF